MVNKEEWSMSLYIDRKALGLTQHAFCDDLKAVTGATVSQQTLARWEKGAMPHYRHRQDLFHYLKHIFELRGLDSRVLKLGFPEISKAQKIRDFLEINPTATGKEAAEVLGVSHGHLRMIKSISGITNKKSAEELLSIVDEQALEICKLKDVIRKLIS